MHHSRRCALLQWAENISERAFSLSTTKQDQRYSDPEAQKMVKEIRRKNSYVEKIHSSSDKNK